VNFAKSSDGKVKVTFEIITPDVAKEYLTKNRNNRSLSEVLAETYGRDMSYERWYLNTDAIGFDSSGALMNGQHRLAAVARSGQSVEMMVVYGLDPNARATVDIQRKRTIGDELKMRGVSNNNTVAAAVRMRLNYENQTVGLTQAFRYSNTDIIEWANVWHDDLQHAVARAKQVYNNVKVSPMILTAAYSIFHSIDPDLADYYYEKLYTGENVSGTILTVMKRLNSQKFSQVKLPSPYVLWILIRGWNALRKDETINRIILPDLVTGKNMIKAI
jgi:hypothetical protein